MAQAKDQINKVVLEKISTDVTALVQPSISTDSVGAKTEEYKIWENTVSEFSSSQNEFMGAVSQAMATYINTSAQWYQGLINSASLTPGHATPLFYTMNRTQFNAVATIISGGVGASILWDLRFGTVISGGAYGTASISGFLTNNTSSGHILSGTFISNSIVPAGRWVYMQILSASGVPAPNNMAITIDELLYY